MKSYRRFGNLQLHYVQTHNFAPSPHSEFAFSKFVLERINYRIAIFLLTYIIL